MSTLYSIDQAILSCVDAETGEIIDSAALDALLMQREEKLESVALWIKNLQSDAVAYKAEKEAFAAREKAALNKADSLKNYLTYALQGQKFSTTRCAVSFRKSEAVEILDEASIPQNYVVETVSTKPDKKTIKEAIKAGQEVAGCRLVENLNLSIK